MNLDTKSNARKPVKSKFKFEEMTKYPAPPSSPDSLLLNKSFSAMCRQVHTVVWPIYMRAMDFL
jgi:hypothetical protein